LNQDLMLALQKQNKEGIIIQEMNQACLKSHVSLVTREKLTSQFHKVLKEVKISKRKRIMEPC
jgi:hypothetical protein